MSGFTVRVELHDANWKDYEKLHAEMSRQGFSQNITGSNGVTYALPPAEYRFDGALTKWDVLERAKAAAARVKTSYAVLVSQAVETAWFGLPPAARAVA